MSVPVRDDTIGDYLGGDVAETSLATKSTLESKLGVTLQEVVTKQMLAELLLVHGKDDGTRWKNLRVHRDGMYRLWLGGTTPLWEGKALSGGVDVTETFNTAASDTLGPVLSWTELSGDWDVNGSNQAVVASTTGAAYARADTDMATDDHLCELTVIALSRGAGTSVGVGPSCRKNATATDTHYLFWGAIDASSNSHYLYRGNAGSYTQLGSTNTQDVTLNEVMQVKADANDVTGSRDGVALVGPVTDGSPITGNLRGGIRGYSLSGADSIVIDTVRIADLAAAGLSIPVAMAQYRQRWN